MTTPLATNPLEAFAWSPQPQAQQLLLQIIAEFLGRCPAAAQLARQMNEQTGTRFIDWIGHITLGPTHPLLPRLEPVGYALAATRGDKRIYDHAGGMFPAIVVCDRAGANQIDVAIKVESVADFCAANTLDVPVYGAPLADVRIAIVAAVNDTQLAVIERHGDRYGPPGDVEPSVAMN